MPEKRETTKRIRKQRPLINTSPERSTIRKRSRSLWTPLSPIFPRRTSLFPSPMMKLSKMSLTRSKRTSMNATRRWYLILEEANLVIYRPVLPRKPETKTIFPLTRLSKTLSVSWRLSKKKEERPMMNSKPPSPKETCTRSKLMIM